jgi:rubrerythrin
MGIYSPINITEEIERQFKPTRLAVKELNGVKYFCKTVKANIEAYSGSGVRWGNQVKKYGKENIKTLWVSDWFHCPHRLQEFALMFSEYNQIVESTEWANIIAENGLTGNTGSKKGHMAGIPKPKSATHRKSISDTLTGITLDDRHGKEKADLIRASMSKSHVGKRNTEEAIQRNADANRGKKRSQSTIDKLIESRKHYQQYTCEHCGKVTVPANYYRWHGANCKHQ